MIQPNNLQYFYEEKETSQRVFNYHYRINLVWKFMTYAAVVCGTYALWFTWKQNRDMWQVAANVVQKIEKSGGQTIKNSDGSIQILFDGKIVDTIDKDLSKINQIDAIIKQ